MAGPVSTPGAARAVALFGDIQKNWAWLLALGILSIVLGTVGLGCAFTLTLAGVLLFGWLILIEGGIQLFQAWQCRGWKSIVWHVIVALMHVLAGIVVIRDPLLASGLFTLFLAGAIFASGVMRIVLAFQMRESGAWLWPLLGGAISALLGVMIAAKWPASSFFVIGLFIGIELIVNGWTLVIVALAARRTRETITLPTPEAA